MIILLVLVAIIAIGWLGLQIQPKPFAPYSAQTSAPKMVPIPSGLPAPVERFYHKIYGEQMPVIETAVFTGRASLRPAGPITFPGRFRITHIAGQGYRHYIEACWFGIPILKVNERYLDGRAQAEIPMVGKLDNEPESNQGANLGLWSESLWMPSVFLTDSRVRWEPVDDVTALLIVPFEQSEERYVVRFDPNTDLITYFESMRYHGPGSPSKVLWMNESRGWGTVSGYPVPLGAAAIWMDDGKPWAVFNMENIVFNADVSSYIRQTGE